MPPICFGTYHRLLAKRFSFAIYYKFDGEQISVYAVLDCRRNPAWMRKRLEKSSPSWKSKPVLTV